MQPATDVTLLFLRRYDEVLLAMKKRGFGEGLWNGVGGKIDSGETIEAAMVRETQEEIGVTPTEFTKISVIDFVYPDKHFCGHVYEASLWSGEPTESEEMAPQWFKTTDIPYEQMWADDRLWLNRVLRGERLTSCFVFDADDDIQSWTMTTVTGFAG